MTGQWEKAFLKSPGEYSEEGERAFLKHILPMMANAMQAIQMKPTRSKGIGLRRVEGSQLASGDLDKIQKVQAKSIQGLNGMPIVLSRVE